MNYVILGALFAVFIWVILLIVMGKTEMVKKVRYIGASDEQVRWGNNDDPRGLLEIGNIYEVEHEDVHSWHTKYSLKGIKGKFNSVCFEIA